MILIAENDPAVGKLLVMVLEQRRLRCQLVTDGQAAWERLQAGGVEVLVTDLDMPGVDGHGLLRRLSEAELRPSPVVLVVSGFVDPVLEAELLAHSAVVGVLRKPFDLVGFADRVSEMVGDPGTSASPR